MIGYWGAGLIIIAIGLRDGYVNHYKKNPFISSKYPTLRRYLLPLMWILVGIGMIISGFFVP